MKDLTFYMVSFVVIAIWNFPDVIDKPEQKVVIVVDKAIKQELTYVGVKHGTETV